MWACNTMGFCSRNSTPQFSSLVICWAKPDMTSLHMLKSTLQEASSVWVTRTEDLEAWKKEIEFCECLSDQSPGLGCTPPSDSP